MPAWPFEHHEFLAARLADGLSTSQAAAELNARFGTSYSRNACIGRAVRQNMTRNAAMGPIKKKEKVKGPATLRIRKPIPLPPPIVCVEIDPLHISLTELTDQTCHWPFGDAAPFTFCGHPPAFGGSYCGYHHEVSTRNDQSAA